MPCLDWPVWKRFKQALSLEGVYVRAGTAELIVKAVAVSFFALLLDNFTRNPDSVSSVFVALLCLAPGVTSAFQTAAQFYLSGVVGTLYGTLLNIPVQEWYLPRALGDPSSLFFSVHQVMPLLPFLFTVPMGIAITLYTLFVFRWISPTEISSGLFSVLFVQVLF